MTLRYDSRGNLWHFVRVHLPSNPSRLVFGYVSVSRGWRKTKKRVWYSKVAFGNIWKVLSSSCRDACCHLWRASLINGLLSEPSGCWVRSQHPWPLEGSAAEWTHYCPLVGQRSLSAPKSAFEHHHQMVKGGCGGNIHHPSSRWWRWCSLSFK